MSIIGPNGAGKTTLFNLISGFLKPNKGRMIFDGTELTGMPAHRIATHGLVRTFQKTNLFSEVTVGEGVAMGFHKVTPRRTTFGSFQRTGSQGGD